MLAIFIKNVVFQYKLAVVLAETRDLHLEKMRERFAWKTSKILENIGELHQLQHQQQQQQQHQQHRQQQQQQ